VILLLHNRYRVTGGEERAVEDLAWLIREVLNGPLLPARQAVAVVQQQDHASVTPSG